MDPTTVVALAILFALAAALYSSVGHGGASAYIAAMALLSVAPETMKPTALALNLLVAGLGAWRYWSRGLSNWKLLLAFVLTAAPAAFIGGGIHLPAIYYKPLVGILLWLAAAGLLWRPKALAERSTRPHSATSRRRGPDRTCPAAAAAATAATAPGRSRDVPARPASVLGRHRCRGAAARGGGARSGRGRQEPAGRRARRPIGADCPARAERGRGPGTSGGRSGLRHRSS